MANPAIPSPPPLASATTPGLVSITDQVIGSGKKSFNDILGLAKIVTGSLPAAASYEGFLVYDDSTNELKYSNGTSWVAPATGGGYATIQEEGTPLTVRTVLNFIGSGVSAVDDGANTRTNITVHTASASQEGTVSTGIQIFGGHKEFNTSVAISGATGNTLVVDTNTLVVDATNGRVGIGTTGPTQPLHVVGNGRFTGNVNVEGQLENLVTGIVNVNAGLNVLSNITNSTYGLVGFGHPINLGSNYLTFGGLNQNFKNDSNDALVLTSHTSNTTNRIGLIVDTVNTLTASGTKILSLRTGGVEKLSVTKDGDTTGLGTSTYSKFVASTTAGISFDATAMTTNGGTILQGAGGAVIQRFVATGYTFPNQMYFQSGLSADYIEAPGEQFFSTYVSTPHTPGSANAYYFDTSETLSTSGDRIIVASNNGTDVFHVDYLGGISAAGKSTFSDIVGLPQIATGSLPSAVTYEGYIAYDSTTNEFKYANGTSWVAASGGGGMSIGGTVTSGTVGSVLFVGTGPALAQDNANLFWDDTNDRLGVGTATPTVEVDVVGDIKASGTSTATTGFVIGTQKLYNGSAAPVAGTWVAGDIVFNTTPAPGGNVGWICTTGGTPGTWKEFGLISV